MANEFLKRKWRVCFQGYDINKDQVITMEDAELFTDRFAAHHKFNDKQTAELKEKFRYFWRAFFLKGNDKITEEMHIDRLRDEYNAGKATFRENIKKLLDMITDIYDVNKDGFLSEDELEACLKATGVETFDMSFIKMYPKRRSGLVDVNDFIESWIEFYCNNDKSDISKEKPALCCFRILDG